MPEINPRYVNYKFKKKHVRCSTEIPINAGLVRNPIRCDLMKKLDEIQHYPFHLEVKVIWYKPKEKSK